jgi:hypothetical protein
MTEQYESRVIRLLLRLVPQMLHAANISQFGCG